MTAAICPLMHNTIADSIYTSVVSKSSKYYYFLGKTVPYVTVNGVEQVEVPSTSYSYELSTRRDIISFKQISSTDVSYVVPRIDWVENTVYDYYDDSYSVSSPSYSGSVTINDAKFYVLTSNFNLYMCLDNNYDSPSTIMPTGYDVLPFVTNDGYKWKFIMNVPLALRAKFLTSFYIPITNAVNNIFYNNGAIDTITVDSTGSGYPSNTDAAVTVVSPEISAGSFVIGRTYIISNLGTASSLQTKWNTTAGTSGITYAVGSTFTAANVGSTLTGGKVKGTGAILVPYISSIDGSISSVKITNGGTGYPTGTTLTISGAGTGKFSGNSTALATPVIVNGVIAYVTITDPGKDYNTNATTLTITSDSGSGGRLSAIVQSGQIVDVIIDNPGSGYKDAQITATGAGGSGANFTALVTGGKLDTIQSNVELMSVNGTIDYIRVIDGGFGYYSVSVSILGDGVGATATANITNGSVTSITIVNPGSGYTYANVVLIPDGETNTNPPTARAIISPKGGHGRNALSELFANTLMFYATISQDHSSGFDINNDYRQFGIVKDPSMYDSNQFFYNKSGVTCYSVDVTITNGTVSLDMVLSDSSGKEYIVIAKTSTSLLLHPKDNSVLLSGTMLVHDTISVYITKINYEPNIDRYSGDMLYIDNRSAFYQTSDQTITLQTILKF